ncbi:hypothetical protein [Halorussus halophilus]|uniref:hypothetical protein n=1 Tax=Halorussus halophilus TaxID=2650975 RepID=UPI0013018255|nr:hypothetical protein [Halorussus halophilus]
MKFVELVGIGVTICSTLGGFLYWFARSSAGLATKSYVREQVEDELDPMETRVETALEHARTNETELQELKALIEGGNSQFDQGMIDFLEENIDRTNEIRDELDEVRERITTLKYDDKIREKRRENR